MAYSLSDHFDGERFFNPNSPPAKGLLDVLRWKLTTRSTPWTARTQQASPTSIPPATVDGARCRITFINHSTLLFQYAGINLLTDPVWSDRVSPFSWIGPRRVSAPGVLLKDLPKIHTVLLSHNHYDHLDLPTLNHLSARDRPQFIVPLGVGALLKRNGIRVNQDLDWWDSNDLIVCVPAKHFSARGITDRNRTLWCGYWIPTPAGPVYFAADTAFGPHFEAIRHRLGSPRMALLPIGAYKPEWFMGPVHMSPREAVQAHRILAPERSLAIHWGTFPLADDGPDEPVEDLEEALSKDPGLPPFQALLNGAVIELAS